MDELSGKVFGDLFVVEIGERGPRGHKQWICRCSCGRTKLYRKWLLVSGGVRSCGCKQSENYSATFKAKWDRGERRIPPRGWKLAPLSREHRKKLGAVHKTHGMSKTRVYTIWLRMVSRCTRAEDASYERYGARGITVCADWLAFENFLRDMGNPPSRRHSIERIDNDGGYAKENCRWATASEQANNRRSSKRVVYNGQDMTAAQVASALGIKQQTLQQRLRRGHPIESAILVGSRRGRTR